MLQKPLKNSVTALAAKVNISRKKLQLKVPLFELIFTYDPPQLKHRTEWLNKNILAISL